MLTGTEIKSIPCRAGQPGRGLRAHRARRGLADGCAHRAVRAGQPEQSRADAPLGSCSSIGTRSPSWSGKVQSKGFTLVPLRSTSRTASPSGDRHRPAARRRTTSGAPSPSGTCGASWRERRRPASDSRQHRGRWGIKANTCSTFSGRRGIIGRQSVRGDVRFPTGLRNRNCRSRLPRWPQKIRGKPVQLVQSPGCSRFLDSEHRPVPLPDGEDVIRGGATPPTPVSGVKGPRKAVG